MIMNNGAGNSKPEEDGQTNGSLPHQIDDEDEIVNDGMVPHQLHE
jgi:hypothetical protein